LKNLRVTHKHQTSVLVYLSHKRHTTLTCYLNATDEMLIEVSHTDIKMAGIKGDTGTVVS